MSIIYLRYVEKSYPLLLHALLCILGYIAWLPLVVALPLVLMFALYKLVLKKYIEDIGKIGRVFEKWDMPFLHETESNKNYINALIGGEGKPNVHKLRKFVEKKILKNPDMDDTYQRLKQSVECRFFSYVWKDEENFNIKQHMPIFKGEVPESKVEQEQLFAGLASKPLKSGISPWVIHIIPMKDDRFYMHCKFHHVIGDGFAMVGLLHNLVDETPEYIKVTKSNMRTVNPLRRILEGIVTGPFSLLLLFFSSIPRVWKNPFRAHESPSQKTVSWSAPVSLDLIRRIKSKTETTVNDVLLSCMAGAIRMYLEKEDSSLVTDFPISMTFNSRNMKLVKHDNAPLENQSGGILVNLPISEYDALKRLRVIKQRIDRMKGSLHPYIFSFVYFSIMGLMPAFLGRLSTFSLKNQCSLIYSNVPGPLNQLNIQGLKVKEVIVIPPLHADMGLVTAIFSYAGKINLTVMSDERIIKDPNRLTANFVSEVQHLAERVLIDD